MKLRKAIEITVRYPTNKSVSTWLIDPTDTWQLNYWEKYLISKRVVYRLANYPLWNYANDGPPF